MRNKAEVYKLTQEEAMQKDLVRDHFEQHIEDETDVERLIKEETEEERLTERRQRQRD